MSRLPLPSYCRKENRHKSGLLLPSYCRKENRHKSMLILPSYLRKENRHRSMLPVPRYCKKKENRHRHGPPLLGIVSLHHRQGQHEANARHQLQAGHHSHAHRQQPHQPGYVTGHRSICNLPVHGSQASHEEQAIHIQCHKEHIHQGTLQVQHMDAWDHSCVKPLGCHLQFMEGPQSAGHYKQLEQMLVEHVNIPARAR